MTDFSYGLSIIVLLMADEYFNDNFPFDEMKWRSSFMCFLSFSLALNFSLLSPLSLSFLSVQRCLVIVFPLNAKYKNKQFAVKWLTGIFTVSIVLVVVMCVLMKYLEIIIPLTTCTPFVDPTNSIHLIKIITCLVVILQFGATFMVFIAYSVMIISLQKSDDSILKPNLKKANSMVMFQIITLTVSNIICWIPSGIIYLTSTFSDKYLINIAIWTPIVLTPINSIINPIVFSIASRHRSNKQ